MGGDKAYSYAPIVGDSFTGDTPLFIKYKDSGFIDIKYRKDGSGNSGLDSFQFRLRFE
jgi:hypothetical protein